MVVNMVAEDNPRERYGSLMMLYRAVCGGRTVVINDVVGMRMSVVVIIITATIIIIVLLLRLLTLAIFFIFHSSILKPYFNLPFC